MAGRGAKNKSVEKSSSGRAGLKKGDLVMVISGGNKTTRPNKGQVGKVMRFVGTERVIVEGINMVTRHQKAQGPNQQSGKIQREASIHISNVMLYVEKLKRPVRLKHKLLADGKKVRGYINPESKQFEEYVSTK